MDINKLYQRTCPACDIKFIADHRSRKFCGDKHKNFYNNNKELFEEAPLVEELSVVDSGWRKLCELYSDGIDTISSQDLRALGIVVDNLPRSNSGSFLINDIHLSRNYNGIYEIYRNSPYEK